MDEPTLIAVLSSRFNPHTILLYGSRARGDANPHSDWDVCCVADISEERHLGWCEDGAYMDVFVSPKLPAVSAEALRMVGSRILRDERGAAAAFLAELAELHARGPDPMPPHHAEMLGTWVLKTLERVRRGEAEQLDLEAHYRRHWLLKELLEYAFTLRKQWFPGPKQALAVLRQEEPALWALFVEALAPAAEFVSVERLALAVVARGKPVR